MSHLNVLSSNFARSRSFTNIIRYSSAIIQWDIHTVALCSNSKMIGQRSASFGSATDSGISMQLWNLGSVPSMIWFMRKLCLLYSYLYTYELSSLLTLCVYLYDYTSISIYEWNIYIYKYIYIVKVSSYSSISCRFFLWMNGIWIGIRTLFLNDLKVILIQSSLNFPKGFFTTVTQ